MQIYYSSNKNNCYQPIGAFCNKKNTPLIKSNDLPDQFKLNNKNYSISHKGNILNIISFSGKQEIPPYGFKTYVSKVGAFQNNVRRLERSDWKDGDKLILQRRKYVNQHLIDIIHPELGKLGGLPNQIAMYLLPLIEKGHKFTAELSDLDDGRSKTDNIKIRVNIKYEISEGKTLKDIPPNVASIIKFIQNDKRTRPLIRPYQPVLDPKEILNLLTPQPVVDTIISEINKANSILLIGHTSPDGDAIGSVLGLRAALNAIDKDVQCSIDDDVDGYYRHKLPGIDDNLVTPDKLNPKKKYDLVIIMDTAIPNRVGKGNYPFIKNAKQVIFIDHHPLYKKQWDIHKEASGIDVTKIEKNNLLWTMEDMPATCEMLGGLIFKLLPQEVLEKLSTKKRQELAMPLVAGIATDTEFYKKGSALGAESYAKGLMKWADFGKKWVRDNIYYHLPKDARNKLYQYATKGTTIDKESNFASIQIPYEEFTDVYDSAKKADPDVIKLDIVNAFKYSDIFNSIRNDKRKNTGERVAAIIMERGLKENEGETFISVNLRSPIKTDLARKVATEIGGGGHATMAAAQIYGNRLNEKAYDDDNDTNNKLTLNEKLIQIVKGIKQKANDNVVSFRASIFRNLSTPNKL